MSVKENFSCIAMKTFLLFPVVVLLTVLAACDTDAFNGKLGSGDYLVFGKYHGFCVGDCTVLYKLENDQLYADDLDHGIEQPIPFMPTPMDMAKHALAKHLLSAFPNALLNTDKRTFGCPDCSDQGGYYVELKLDGEINIWNIDTFDADQSQIIIDYKQAIQEVLDQL